MELYVIIVGYFIGMLIWSRKNIIFNNIIFGTNNKIKGLRVGFSALQYAEKRSGNQRIWERKDSAIEPHHLCAEGISIYRSQRGTG